MTLRNLPPAAQLRAFAALVETGSVSKAGVELNVSHAAISQQVRALEAHLGFKLTEKSGRGVALTPQGAKLGKTLTEAFGAISAEVDVLTGADADRPLQITTTPMFAAAWLMPRMGSFRLAHPDIDLMLSPTAAALELSPGGIDLAIRFGRGSWPGLEADLLFHTDFVIAAARSLVGDTPPETPQELLGFPWLQEYGTTETNDWLAARGVTSAKIRGLTHLPGNLLLDGLRSGQGIVATTRTFVEADVARGDVVILSEDDERGFGYFVLRRPGVLRPSARAFQRWIKAEAKTSI